MKICFMGSMDFAAVILEKLNKEFPIDLVVTQPDRPVGRKRILKGTPVKEKALELDIDLFQPENIKKDHDIIINQNFDFIIVAAYGQMIPDIVLEHGKFRAINVHASLLPKYRGGSPMHRAIINGDDYSGVSIMYMVKKMDAGPILRQSKVKIDPNDDVASLEMKLASIGGDLLIETMHDLLNDNVTSNPQNQEKVTYAYHIKKEEQKLNFNKTAKDNYNLVRGLHPWPIAFFEIAQTPMKVYKADYIEEDALKEVGQIVKINKDGVFIQTSKGQFILKEVQLRGKKRMSINDFMNGIGRQLFVKGQVI
jgi:methionyl-tRNA formyltransferase